MCRCRQNISILWTMKMFLPFSNGIGHQVLTISWKWEMRNDCLWQIKAEVGKHMHGVLPLWKNCITVSLPLAISGIKCWSVGSLIVEWLNSAHWVWHLQNSISYFEITLMSQNKQIVKKHIITQYNVKLVKDNCTWLWSLLHYNTSCQFYVSLEFTARAWGCGLISSCSTFLLNLSFFSARLFLTTCTCMPSFLWWMFPGGKRLVCNTTSGSQKPCEENMEKCLQIEGKKLHEHVHLLVVWTKGYNM